jgi:hypothetical protein
MKKVHKTVLFVVAACLVTAGTAFGVLVFTTWGAIDYENTYYYNPGAPSSVERINLNCDIGSLLIKYNTTPTDYYAQVDLDIHLEGILVKDSSFSDFFYIPVWDNVSSPITFTLDAKATTWFYFGLLRQVKINLTLRTDVVYDINTQASTGALSMIVPEDVTLNNTYLASSTGRISLNAANNVVFQSDVILSSSTGSISLYANHVNFSKDLKVYSSTGSQYFNVSNCLIGEDFVCISSTGSIDFNSYNMKYTDGNLWYFESSTGDIDVTILQYTSIGSNVTGSILTSTGSIDIYYRDNSASLGASFYCSTSTGTNSYNPVGVGGFTQSGENPKDITSDDYASANNRYTLTLTSSTGSINVAAESL